MFLFRGVLEIFQVLFLCMYFVHCIFTLLKHVSTMYFRTLLSPLFLGDGIPRQHWSSLPNANCKHRELNFSSILSACTLAANFAWVNAHLGRNSTELKYRFLFRTDHIWSLINTLQCVGTLFPLDHYFTEYLYLHVLHMLYENELLELELAKLYHKSVRRLVSWSICLQLAAL